MNVGGVTSRIHPQPCAPRRRTRALLAVVEVFVGVGALYGGLNLMVDAEGFGLEASWLSGTPFPSYTIPGVFLFVVIGGGMLAAAATALIGSRWAALAAFCMGVALLAFLAVETAAIGYHGAEQIYLLAIMATSGVVLVAVGSRALQRPGGSRRPMGWPSIPRQNGMSPR